MFAIIENHLKHPLHLREIWLNQPGNAVAIFNTLEIAIGRPTWSGAIFFLNLGEIDILRIFCFIFVDDGIASIVVTFADQPAKNARGILGVRDSGICLPAIKSSDVLFGDRAPEGLAGLPVGQALNAREETLNAATVHLDNVRCTIVLSAQRGVS